MAHTTYIFDNNKYNEQVKEIDRCISEANKIINEFDPVTEDEFKFFAKVRKNVIDLRKERMNLLNGVKPEMQFNDREIVVNFM